jgi:hypothetical protein
VQVGPTEVDKGPEERFDRLRGFGRFRGLHVGGFGALGPDL